MKKVKKKANKGITLIALVITIIVLLILVGVTIATLTGENGILTQANKAKELTGEAGAIEKVGVEVIGSYGKDGKIDLEELNNNLKNNVKGLTYKGSEISDANKIESLPARVIVDGYEVVINGEGSVTKAEWTQNGTEVTNGKVTLKVGDYVNYKHTEGAKTQTVTSYGTENGYGDQIFNLSSYTGKWKVLGEDGGKLLLIAENSICPDTGGYEKEGKYYYDLKGQEGYKNSISELDKISSMYGQGKYAYGARSVKVEDIDKITEYSPDTDQLVKGELYEYGNKVTYSWQGTDYPYYSATNGLTGSLSR